MMFIWILVAWIAIGIYQFFTYEKDLLDKIDIFDPKYSFVTWLFVISVVTGPFYFKVR